MLMYICTDLEHLVYQQSVLLSFILKDTSKLPRIDNIRINILTCPSVIVLDAKTDCHLTHRTCGANPKPLKHRVSHHVQVESFVYRLAHCVLCGHAQRVRNNNGVCAAVG
mmetsp:Transcript_1526/g.2808  ORF Transcript_1526/g.2808 Transcript_1526/m.2808 type:complete len:110 (-) Transcript_1526:674-1003(-)